MKSFSRVFLRAGQALNVFGLTENREQSSDVRRVD